MTNDYPIFDPNAEDERPIVRLPDDLPDDLTGKDSPNEPVEPDEPSEPVEIVPETGKPVDPKRQGWVEITGLSERQIAEAASSIAPGQPVPKASAGENPVSEKVNAVLQYLHEKNRVELPERIEPDGGMEIPDQPTIIGGDGVIVHQQDGATTISLDRREIESLLPESGTFVTPYDLDPADLQDETADEKTWTRATPPADTDGFKWSGPRVVFSTTDKKYYRFHRVITHDSRGSVASVSAETKVEIIDLVPCAT